MAWSLTLTIFLAILVHDAASLLGQTVRSCARETAVPLQKSPSYEPAGGVEAGDPLELLTHLADSVDPCIAYSSRRACSLLSLAPSLPTPRVWDLCLFMYSQ